MTVSIDANDVMRRQVAHFAKAEPACGAGVARRVGLVERSPRSRRVALGLERVP
jgi:hypothetical protein